MSGDYQQSYLGQLRKLIGKEKIFAITTRAIVQDENGRLLLIRRRDDGQWGMPAGSIELDWKSQSMIA